MDWRVERSCQLPRFPNLLPAIACWRDDAGAAVALSSIRSQVLPTTPNLPQVVVQVQTQRSVAGRDAHGG